MINYEVERPKSSQRFDVEDIRTLRIWKSERWKNASFDEIKKDITELAKPISDKISYVFDKASNSYIHYPEHMGKSNE